MALLIEILKWQEVSRLPVTISPGGKSILLSELEIRIDETLSFDAPVGSVEAGDLQKAVQQYIDLTNGTCQPQLAAYVFSITRQPYALRRYFPLTKVLNDAELREFDVLLNQVAQHPNLDVRLIGEHHHDMTEQLPADVAHLVAGHLAEMFFYRRDLLDALLKTPRPFWLYTTTEAYKQGGGVGGGSYHSGHGSIRMVISRMYEGFNGVNPGGAPFLHEFGHMLDFFDGRTYRAGKSAGLPLGMRPGDGMLYTPGAHEHFQRGKKLELKRYLRLHHGMREDHEPFPVGSPYVFQNDREFVAGYLEMFFRNPHYFADLNPDLYQGFVELFKQDPRRVWDTDYDYYIKENRGIYLSGKPIKAPGLTV
jgi:hypothetical protein